MAEGSSIVFISSIGGLRGAASVYGVSKAGVDRLTLGLAANYAPQNIRANRFNILRSDFHARSYSLFFQRFIVHADVQ